MCGIFGGYGISADECRKGIDLIKRGEDGITISKLNENIAFAARRHLVKKSGNDLKNNLSDQPYFSKDKRIALVFNGEFYNFEIFKKKLITEKFNFISSGDTEVFLKLYEKEGINFLKNKDIDSLFAIAIYDLTKKKIFITRDWPGRIPLYYYFDKKKFIFSSELKAFRAIKGVSLQKPLELEPGNLIEFDIEKKNISKTQFFKPRNNLIKKDTKILEVGKKLNRLLDESAKNRTMADVPICTMLSGGIDSVLSTFYVFKNLNFKKIGYQPTSYVFSVEGFNSTDVEKARITANSFSSIGLKLVEVKASREQIVNVLSKSNRKDFEDEETGILNLKKIIVELKRKGFSEAEISKVGVSGLDRVNQWMANCSDKLSKKQLLSIAMFQ